MSLLVSSWTVLFIVIDSPSEGNEEKLAYDVFFEPFWRFQFFNAFIKQRIDVLFSTPIKTKNLPLIQNNNYVKSLYMLFP